MADGIEEWRHLLEGDKELRRARIQALSDEELSRIYGLLSDARYVANVPVLPLVEQELYRRRLPLAKRH